MRRSKANLARLLASVNCVTRPKSRPLISGSGWLGIRSATKAEKQVSSPRIERQPEDSRCGKGQEKQCSVVPETGGKERQCPIGRCGDEIGWDLDVAGWHRGVIG